MQGASLVIRQATAEMRLGRLMNANFNQATEGLELCRARRMQLSRPGWGVPNKCLDHFADRRARSARPALGQFDRNLEIHGIIQTVNDEKSAVKLIFPEISTSRNQNRNLGTRRRQKSIARVLDSQTVTVRESERIEDLQKNIGRRLLLINFVTCDNGVEQPCSVFAQRR